MNHDRLRSDLAGLADEVTPVDLRDRALRTSRRLGIQRTVATTAAALVLVAAATGTALAVRPNGAPTPDPAGPSVTATTPGPDSTPSRVPTEPSADPSTPTSGDPSGSVADGRLGRIFYIPQKVVGAKTVPLRSWQPGSQPRKLAELPELPALVSARVSPDGARVAWVEDDGNGGSTLYVADVNGAHKQSMGSGLGRYCVPPTWSPDSRRLLIRETAPDGAPGRFGVLDTRGDQKPVRWWKTQPQACNAFWSSDGKTIAMESESGVALFDTDGNRKLALPAASVPNAPSGMRLVGLAPDGGRIAVYRLRKGDDGGDVSRVLRANAVLDTGTGAEMELPLDGRELMQVYFRPDGDMIVRVRDGIDWAVLLVDRDGRKLAERAEPTSFRSAYILAAVG
jgi:dipeptidyl aminopeptidase/acylaminoacyl peptidase